MDYKEAASENLILKVKVGSQLFGTDTPESDLDMEGIFMPPETVLFGFGECKEVDLGVVSKQENGRNDKDAIDFKVREYRTFARLALQCNPNILNVLFVNSKNVLYSNEYGKRLREMAEFFVHQQGLKRYHGYAVSQMKKMTLKPEGYDALNRAKWILERSDPDEILVNATAQYGDFKDEGPGKHIRLHDLNFERGLKVRRVLSMIEDRIERASARSANWNRFGYDTKFASNLIQLLTQGIELGTTGRLQFPLRNKGYILDIKKGEYSLSDIEKSAQQYSDQLSELIHGKCNLPRKPQQRAVEEFVVEEVKRWASNNYY